MVENLQREDIHPLEESLGFKSLFELGELRRIKATLVSVALLLQVGLRIGGSTKCFHGGLEFAVARSANGNRRCDAEPFDDSKVALRLWIVSACHGKVLFAEECFSAFLV